MKIESVRLISEVSLTALDKTKPKIDMSVNGHRLRKIDIGDGCLRQIGHVGDGFFFVLKVNNIVILPPTSSNCHQHYYE